MKLLLKHINISLHIPQLKLLFNHYVMTKTFIKHYVIKETHYHWVIIKILPSLKDYVMNLLLI